MRRGLWAFRLAVTALVGIDLALGAVRVRAELLQLHGATLALNVLLFGSGPLVAGVGCRTTSAAWSAVASSP